MIEAGMHWDYVATAYAISLGLILAVIAWVAFDARRQRLKLAALEARGIRRRSARAGTPAGSETGTP